MRQGTVNVTTSPTLILSANGNRESVILYNSSTLSVSIGYDTNISTNNVAIGPSGTLTEDNSGSKMYLGPYYGITSAGTAVIAVWERTK
jgi:hypothetical protein